MTDETAALPGTVTLEPASTILNPETVSTVSGGGRIDTSNADDGSIESVLEAELASLKENDAKGEADAKAKAESATKEAKEKADETAKAEKKDDPKGAKTDRQRSENGKFAKTGDEDTASKADRSAPEQAATERSAQDDNRQSEGRKYAEPPARFLPEARGKWANVPNEVKAEFHRVAQEYEQENAGYRQSHERYQQIRQFDDMARANGRDLRDTLEKVMNVEHAIAQNPIAGVDMLLREIGPRKQDGTPLTLMEVARHIVQNPQAYQQASAPVMQVQQAAAPSREIVELRAEIQSLKAEQTIVPLIERFTQSHPDFHQLEPQISAILESGVIENLYGNGLSAEQRLAEAYRMAGGHGPSSRSEPESAPPHSRAGDVPSKDAGTKSVRGAPANGEDTAAEDDDSDIDAILRKEMRKIRA